jgi:hypothetical protein
MLKRPNARCIECAYLEKGAWFDVDGKIDPPPMTVHHWGFVEAHTADRRLAGQNTHPQGFQCQKREIDMPALVAAGKNWAELLNAGRRCDWHERNNDLSFADADKSRHDRREFQRRLIAGGLVAAVGGAIAFLFNDALPHLLWR